MRGREAMSQQVSPDAPKQGTTLSYLPALDGIRGVAMIGILGVHGEVYLTAGGFYLLDSFFALSGFLITSLLIVEWRKSGTVKLKVFWARRARRLLPALFVMLIGVAILYGLFVPAGTYPTLRGDALSALFYFANWHFIAAGDNYFDQTALTSPLIHMWSLALEEQFYLVWPLVVLGLLQGLAVVAGPVGRLHRRGASLGAGDGTRLQPDGRDPRLLRHRHPCPIGAVGASLAVGLAMWADRRRKGEEQDWQARTARARSLLTAIGVIGIAVTAILCITVHSDQAFAYRGGFLLAAIAASAVLLSVSCAQSSPVAKVLSFTVFTYIGRISYSTYLWHFPLFIFINHARTGLTGWPLFAVRVVPTLAVASASFFFVERPIRQGTFFTSFRVRILTVPAAAVVVVAIVLATMPATETYAGGSVALGGVPATPIERRHSGGVPAHPRPGASRR